MTKDQMLKWLSMYCRVGQVIRLVQERQFKLIGIGLDEKADGTTREDEGGI